jgi:hypothetical protein
MPVAAAIWPRLLPCPRSSRAQPVTPAGWRGAIGRPMRRPAASATARACAARSAVKARSVFSLRAVLPAGAQAPARVLFGPVTISHDFASLLPARPGLRPE